MTQIEIAELYKTSQDFKTYADKYAKAHRMLVEDTFKTAIVRNYAEYMKGVKG